MNATLPINRKEYNLAIILKTYDIIHKNPQTDLTFRMRLALNLINRHSKINSQLIKLSYPMKIVRQFKPKNDTDKEEVALYLAAQALAYHYINETLMYLDLI